MKLMMKNSKNIKKKKKNSFYEREYLLTQVLPLLRFTRRYLCKDISMMDQ